MIANEKNAAAKKPISIASVLTTIKKLASKITTLHLAVLFVIASIFLAYICVAPPTDLPNWPLYRINTRIWQSLERFGKHVKPYHLRVLTSASQHFESRVLFLITYMDVPDHLHKAGKPLSCEELKPLIDEANVEIVNLPYLCRVLHAASHFDFLVEAEEHKYELSELGKYLVKSHPKSLNGYVQMIAGDEAFIIATALSRSIFTGNSGFKETYREELLDHLKSDPPFQEIFDRGMADNARLVAPAIIADYPSFGSCKHICDIGGGVGSFLYSVLEYYTYGIKGTVFDLTDVIDGAKLVLEVYIFVIKFALFCAIENFWRIKLLPMRRYLCMLEISLKPYLNSGELLCGVLHRCYESEFL